MDLGSMAVDGRGVFCGKAALGAVESFIDLPRFFSLFFACHCELGRYWQVTFWLYGIQVTVRLYFFFTQKEELSGVGELQRSNLNPMFMTTLPDQAKHAFDIQ